MGACRRQISAINKRARPTVWVSIYFIKHLILSVMYLCVQRSLNRAHLGVGPRAQFLAGLQPRRKAIRFHNTYGQTDRRPVRPLLLWGPLLSPQADFITNHYELMAPMRIKIFVDIYMLSVNRIRRKKLETKLIG